MNNRDETKSRSITILKHCDVGKRHRANVQSSYDRIYGWRGEQ